MKKSPFDYQELAVKLEKRISLKKSRNATAWKSFKKTQKTTISKTSNFNLVSTKVT